MPRQAAQESSNRTENRDSQQSKNLQENMDDQASTSTEKSLDGDTEMLRNCISSCIRCHNICLESAMSQCLDMGGDHVEPEHFRLLVNCADICQVAADFMLSRSQMHGRVCDLCAEICAACAESCEQVGEMDECAQACRECEQQCRQMVA
jgi:hypothetical protein